MPILGPATTSSHSSMKAAWIWFVNVPGMKQPATRVALMAAKCQYSSLATVPGDDADLSSVLNGNKGLSCQQQLLPGPLQALDGDTITVSFVDVLFQLEIKGGAT